MSKIFTFLLQGTIAKIKIFLDTKFKEDETTYLLKSEANKKHLLKAIENVNQGNLIYIDLDEYEKIRI